MATRKYSKAKLSSKLGVSLSDDQYKEIEKIKASSPAKTTYKNIAKAYFSEENFYLKTEKDRPVNSVLDNIEEYIKRNPKTKIYIKYKGAKDFMSVSAKAATIAMTKLNSEAWRDGENKEKPVSGNYIPEIEVTEFLNVKTKVANKVFLDFNTISYSK